MSSCKIVFSETREVIRSDTKVSKRYEFVKVINDKQDRNVGYKQLNLVGQQFFMIKTTPDENELDMAQPAVLLICKS